MGASMGIVTAEGWHPQRLNQHKICDQQTSADGRGEVQMGVFFFSPQLLWGTLLIVEKISTFSPMPLCPSSPLVAPYATFPFSIQPTP